MQDIDLNTCGDDGGGGGGGSVVLDSPESGTSHQAAELRKLSPSKYKGVVPLPSGRWGAQIYEKHHRVWLGTFQDEADAGRTYDIAAQRFRGRDAVLNFTPLSTDTGASELRFLNFHSKAEIVDMLRKHTYQDELQHSSTLAFNYPRHTVGRWQHSRELLFEKVVTPSDVGKLNRLVIPKHHAENHFPLKATNEPMGSVANRCKSVLLNVEDVGGKVWRFRYAYWSSSQSYVLTKGWSGFAKEKNLSAGDVICFLRSVDGGNDGNRLYIDWKRGNNVRDGGFYPYVLPVPATVRLQTKAFRLFGVNIDIDDVCRLDLRRRDQLEMFSAHYFCNNRRRT